MRSDKAFIYSMQSYDEPCIPVTARIEWLPNGKIVPLSYWLPDNTCFEIKHVYEVTRIAFLKGRGEGIRFRVRIEAIPEPYFGHRLTQHEVYLYFADNWFCGKNFIDGRYGHEGKEFIPVTLDVFPNGEYELIYFKAQGIRYMVEKTIAVEPRGSFHAGGVGMCHKVEARQVNDNDDEDPDPNKSNIRIAALFFEGNKWFVSVKTK